MATRKVLLPEDRTGLQLDNFILNELKSIGVGRNRLLVLEYGAFFKEGLILKDLNGAVIDSSLYMLTDLYEEASRVSGKEVWNCIVVESIDVPSSITVTYHAYGGKFSANTRLLKEWVDEKLATTSDPADWTDLIEKPLEFEPKFHMHLWREVYGFEYIKTPLTQIENAIRLDTGYFFHSLIDDIKRKLAEAEEKAMELARYYAIKAIDDATVKINKQTLDIHLLANLGVAGVGEMANVARSTFDSSSILEDKYINKKGLIAFTKVLKDRSIDKNITNLGMRETKIADSMRGSLVVMGNGALCTFETKKNIVAAGNYYEENVYPKNYPETDRFTVVRVTNNVDNHGGVFLGFNNTTGVMYSGVLKDDSCFRRIEWYEFYSDPTYDGVKAALAEHINAKNNPHLLTKKQVELEKVVNLPVATAEQILGDEPSDSYITLDGLALFMVKNMLNLKAEYNEDGSLNKDSDLFNKPNLIFTPCDKKVPDNWPPEGMLLKTYCDGTDRFQRLADGKGGWTDTVLELNSDDCKYFLIRPQGEVLHTYCNGVDEQSVIADGRGGTSVITTAINSLKCGYITPPEAGTVLNTSCVGYDMMTKYADGRGGEIEVLTAANSTECGYVPITFVPAGTVLSESCVGANIVKKMADGRGGEEIIIVQVNSPTCGFVTTTTTTSTPGRPRIVYSTSLRDIEAGSVETQTAMFSGYKPNFVINATVQAKMTRTGSTGGAVFGGSAPTGNGNAFADYVSMLNNTIITDDMGNGIWVFTVVDDGSIPRNSSWDNKVIDDIGTTSNVIVRNFVGAGMAGPPLPPPPTQAPRTTTPTPYTPPPPPSAPTTQAPQGASCVLKKIYNGVQGKGEFFVEGTYNGAGMLTGKLKPLNLGVHTELRILSSPYSENHIRWVYCSPGAGEAEMAANGREWIWGASNTSDLNNITRDMKDQIGEIVMTAIRNGYCTAGLTTQLEGMVPAGSRTGTGTLTIQTNGNFTMFVGFAPVRDPSDGGGN